MYHTYYKPTICITHTINLLYVSHILYTHCMFQLYYRVLDSIVHVIHIVNIYYMYHMY